MTDTTAGARELIEAVDEPNCGLILPAVSLSRISPPRGGEYLHEVTAGSINWQPLFFLGADELRSEARELQAFRTTSISRQFPSQMTGLAVHSPRRISMWKRFSKRLHAWASMATSKSSSSLKTLGTRMLSKRISRRYGRRFPEYVETVDYIPDDGRTRRRACRHSSPVARLTTPKSWVL